MIKSCLIFLSFCSFIFLGSLQPITVSSNGVSAIDEISVRDLKEDIAELRTILTELSQNVSSFFPGCLTSCRSLLDTGLAHPSGFYSLCPEGFGGERVHTYCNMDVLGGGWTLIGQTKRTYPPSDFLANSYGYWFNQSRDDLTAATSPQTEFSIAAWRIPFTELALAVEGLPIWQGFQAPAGVVRSRLFEPEPTGAETCVSVDSFLYDLTTGTLYSYYQAVLAETLLSNRRDWVTGGIDMASSDCFGSRDGLALYRQGLTAEDSEGHVCAAGLCDVVGFSFYSAASGAYKGGDAANHYGPHSLFSAPAALLTSTASQPKRPVAVYIR
eukprot:GCRY01000840.1.p1 GENE.GCRY01000840.1~~GCRY01000840.1.p1  ORF type:complete len:327 (-),score=63.10 GCRY01000840.1:865-1845(-)